jgi:SCP-2 sterol transfer family
LASKREVEKRLRELMKRLDDADRSVHSSLADTMPEPKVILVTFPDLDASYWTTMADGTMDGLHAGPCERPDIRLRVDSDHLVDLLDGRRSFLSSFVSGQVKIDASLSDLLRLRKLA